MIREFCAGTLVLATLLQVSRPGSSVPVHAATYEAHIEDATLLMEGEGSLDPETEQVVAVPGEMGETHVEKIVEEGTRVKKGDVLCHLSTFTIEESERQAREERVVKETELLRLQEEGAVAAADDQKKVTSAREELAYNRRTLAFLERGPDPRLVRSLELKIERARLTEANLQKRLFAQQALMKKGYVAALDFAAIRTDLSKASLDRAKQENLLALTREGPSRDETEKAQTLCEKWTHDLALAETTERSQKRLRELAIEKKKAEIQDRQRAMEEWSRQRNRAALKAPLDGIVLYPEDNWRGPPTEGSLVWRGMALLRVVQQGKLRGKVQINERWINRIKVGQKAQVFAANRSEPFPAVVDSISRLATPRDDGPKSPRDFTVELKLAADSARLRPGMSCRALIEVARHPQVSRVPIDLIRSRNGREVELIASRKGSTMPIKARLVDEDRDFVYLMDVPNGETLVY